MDWNGLMTIWSNEGLRKGAFITHKVLLAVVKCQATILAVTWSQSGCLATSLHLRPVAKTPTIMCSPFAFLLCWLSQKVIGEANREECRLLLPAKRILSCLRGLAERASSQGELNCFSEVKKWNSDPDGLSFVSVPHGRSSLRHTKMTSAGCKNVAQILMI